MVNDYWFVLVFNLLCHLFTFQLSSLEPVLGSRRFITHIHVLNQAVSSVINKYQQHSLCDFPATKVLFLVQRK